MIIPFALCCSPAYGVAIPVAFWPRLFIHLSSTCPAWSRDLLLLLLLFLLFFPVVCSIDDVMLDAAPESTSCCCCFFLLCVPSMTSRWMPYLNRARDWGPYVRGEDSPGVRARLLRCPLIRLSYRCLFSFLRSFKSLSYCSSSQFSLLLSFSRLLQFFQFSQFAQFTQFSHFSRVSQFSNSEIS